MNATEVWVVTRSESGRQLLFNTGYTSRELAARAIEADIEELSGIYSRNDYTIHRVVIQGARV